MAMYRVSRTGCFTDGSDDNDFRMSGWEIERKFKVREGTDYKSMAYHKSEIVQGYIPTLSCAIRVRKNAEKTYLTIKGTTKASGISRYEFEKEITAEEFKQLLSMCHPNHIEKTRYLIKNGKHVIELDEFHGQNKGLIMAEIELSHPDEPFEKPDFLGEEISQERKYHNAHLVLNPYCEWPENEK